MKLPSLRVQHGLLFALVALLFFGWGAWLMRAPAPAEPLPWLRVWQAQLLPALASEQLTLADLSRETSGELWLQSQPTGPRLLYRAPVGTAPDAWLLSAELHLSDVERDGLVAAVGAPASHGEQPLSGRLLEQLGRLSVLTLEFTPGSAVPAARLAATVGAPRLRLGIEDGEAWIYPTLGLTAQVQDETLLLLRVQPKSAMQR